MSANNRPPTPPVETPAPTSITAIALRILWMIVGNAALVISGFWILQVRDAFFSVADATYGAAIPLLIVARYLDIARFGGSTAYGEPATMAHWRRYAAAVLGGAVAAWLLLHGIAYLQMK